VKRIRKSGAARLASWALTVVICWSTLCHFGAPRAYSQAAASSVQAVVVIDFENKAGNAHLPLVRLATDAVAVELANSARYAMLTLQEVDRQVKELGLRPPFDRVALSRRFEASNRPRCRRRRRSGRVGAARTLRASRHCLDRRPGDFGVILSEPSC